MQVWHANGRRPRILHTMVRVTDVDAALRFYTGGLGMTVLDRWNVSSRQGTVHCLGYDTSDGGCLQLLHDPDARDPCSHGSGYGHVSIGVPDLPAVVARLEAMGAEISLPPTRLLANGPHLSFVKDPEGYSLELLEFDPRSWVGGTRTSRPRFMHTMIRVRDMDAAVRFYRDGLGMQLLDRIEVEARRATAQFLGYDDYNGWCMEVVRSWDAREPYSHGSGYGHVAIGSPDVGAMVARLAAMGIETVLHSARAGAGSAVASVRDPEGYSLELMRI